MAILNETMPPRRVLVQSAMGLVRAAAYATSLGAAFGLGLWASGDHGVSPEEALSPLAAADARTTKLIAVRENLQMRFHAELTGKPRVDTEGPSLLQRAREPKPAASAHDKEIPAATTSSRTAESSSGTVPTAPLLVRDAAEEMPLQTRRDRDAALDEGEEPIASPPERETPEDRTVAARSLAASSLGVAARPFTVQIASTPSEEGAASVASALRKEGHAARVVSATVEGKGTVYRVRVGTFTKRDDAERYRAKLKQGFVLEEEPR